MDSRKLFFVIAILALVLFETTLGKSQRRLKRKNDNETDATKEVGVSDDHDASRNSTSNEFVKGTDDSAALAASPASKSNVTTTTHESKKERKAHRLKHRRAHHKRKQHYKRARKNKRRNEKHANQPEEHHELATAGILGSGNTELSSEPNKETPERVRNHHHKKSSKHHERQQRRLHRRKKFRAHAVETPKSTDP